MPNGWYTRSTEPYVIHQHHKPPVSFFLIIIFTAIGWLFYTVYLKKLLVQGKAGKIKLAVIALGLVFLFMAATGKAHAVFALLGAAMTQVMRFAPLLMRFGPSIKRHMGGLGSKPRAAGVSTVSTATLIMTLDQESGSVDGEVIAADLSGRKLSDLSMDELIALHQYCRNHDKEALRLLDTYISRERATEWQHSADDSQQENQRYAATTTEMSVPEAVQVLGLNKNFTKKQITAAHRSLMGKFHPDKGGNDYLATKLNTARDILLNQLEES